MSQQSFQNIIKENIGKDSGFLQYTVPKMTYEDMPKYRLYKIYNQLDKKNFFQYVQGHVFEFVHRTDKKIDEKYETDQQQWKAFLKDVAKRVMWLHHDLTSINNKQLQTKTIQNIEKFEQSWNAEYSTLPHISDLKTDSKIDYVVGHMEQIKPDKSDLSDFMLAERMAERITQSDQSSKPTQTENKPEEFSLPGFSQWDPSTDSSQPLPQTETKPDQSKKIVGILIAMVALGFSGSQIVKALKRVKKILDNGENVTLKKVLGPNEPTYNKRKTHRQKTKRKKQKSKTK